MTGVFFNVIALHKDIHCFLLWFMSRSAPFRTPFLAISATHGGLAASTDIAIFPHCSFFCAVPPAPQPVIPQEPLMMMAFPPSSAPWPFQSQVLLSKFANQFRNIYWNKGRWCGGGVTLCHCLLVLHGKITDLLQSPALGPYNQNNNNNIFAKCFYVWKIWCKLKAA